MHPRFPLLTRAVLRTWWIAPLVMVAACGGDDIESINNPPTISILDPLPGEAMRPGILHVEVDMEDPDPGQKASLSGSITVTNETGGTVFSCTKTGNQDGDFSCDSPEELVAGTYRVTARATDAKGVPSDPAAVDFTVVNDAPDCAFLTPPSGSSQNYDQTVPVTIQVSTSDDFDAPENIEVCLTSDAIGPLAPCKKAPSTGPVLFQVEFSRAGNQIVTASCKDQDGAVGKDNFTAVVAPCEDEDGDGVSPCASIDPVPDCDDDDPDTYPGATEICDGVDNDCNRAVDDPPDRDGDGFNECEGDCDDRNISISPNGTEICNGKDDDCDGTTDEGFDTDNDTYPVCSVGSTPADCDDTNNATFPGATEICDGKDNNCNSLIDDRDLDKDNWVSADCTLTNAPQTGDCNDAVPQINPGATETCNAIDDDCDGRIDDHTPCADDDGDGFCEEDCGDGSEPGDCDDGQPWSYPGAVERFDTLDNNCDGLDDGRVWPISKAWVALEGELTNAKTGWSIDGGANVDGDKSWAELPLEDMVIGAPYFDTAGGQRGGAYLLRGQEPPDWPMGQSVSLATLHGSGKTTAFLFQETLDVARAGWSVAMGPDADGDGRGEFAIGAPFASAVVLGGTISDAGTSYLFLSKGLTLADSITNAAKTKVAGTATGVYCGYSLAIGDVNGDNFADMVMGAPQSGGEFTGGAGWAFMLFGRSSDSWPSSAKPGEIFILPGNSGTALGTGVTFIGKHNGDALGDFAVGGAYNSGELGAVWRVPGSANFKSGSNANIDEVQNGAWFGQAAGEMVGWSMDGGADINGDAFADLLIGRERRTDSSVPLAYVQLGAAAITPESGNIGPISDVAFKGAADDDCPCAVAGIGDLNADGLDDFAISASSATVNGVSRAGRVYILLGRDYMVEAWPASVDLSVEADYVIEGEITDQRIGFSLAGVGDINGDGGGDFAIGAPHESPDSSRTGAGKVYLQFGAYIEPYTPYND